MTVPRCGKCYSVMRVEPACYACPKCGRRDRRPAIPADEARQDQLDRDLRARSVECRALSQCDTCWHHVAPGVFRCERCKLRARLAAMTEGERNRVLGSVGLLAL